MRELFLRLLATALLMALSVGPIASIASARHIEARSFRAAGQAVAEAARSGDAEAHRNAVDALVGLVTTPGEDHEDDDDGEVEDPVE